MAVAPTAGRRFRYIRLSDVPLTIRLSAAEHEADKVARAGDDLDLSVELFSVARKPSRILYRISEDAYQRVLGRKRR